MSVCVPDNWLLNQFVKTANNSLIQSQLMVRSDLFHAGITPLQGQHNKP